MRFPCMCSVLACVASVVAGQLSAPSVVYLPPSSGPVASTPSGFGSTSSVQSVNSQQSTSGFISSRPQHSGSSFVPGVSGLASGVSGYFIPSAGPQGGEGFVSGVQRPDGSSSSGFISSLGPQGTGSLISGVQRPAGGSYSSFISSSDPQDTGSFIFGVQEPVPVISDDYIPPPFSSGSLGGNGISLQSSHAGPQAGGGTDQFTQTGRPSGFQGGSIFSSDIHSGRPPPVGIVSHQSSSFNQRPSNMFLDNLDLLFGTGIPSPHRHSSNFVSDYKPDYSSNIFLGSSAVAQPVVGTIPNILPLGYGVTHPAGGSGLGNGFDVVRPVGWSGFGNGFGLAHPAGGIGFGVARPAGGSGLGNSFGVARLAGGSGIANGFGVAHPAGGSGFGNDFGLAHPAGDSGFGNDFVLAHPAGDSGFGVARPAGGSGLGNSFGVARPLGIGSFGSGSFGSGSFTGQGSRPQTGQQQQVFSIGRPRPGFSTSSGSSLDRVQLLNVHPGGGNSGPLGHQVGTCSASLICIPEAMCNPYTGFVRGGLLFEPEEPTNQPTVALDRCNRLKDGGFGEGVCCQMAHINDPWPRDQ